MNTTPPTQEQVSPRVLEVLRVAKKLRVVVDNTRYPAQPNRLAETSHGPTGLEAGRGYVAAGVACNHPDDWEFLLHEVGHAIFTADAKVSPDLDPHGETLSGQDVWEASVVSWLFRRGRLTREALRSHHGFQTMSNRRSRWGSLSSNYKRHAEWRLAQALALESGACRSTTIGLVPTWQWPTFTPLYKRLYAEGINYLNRRGCL